MKDWLLQNSSYRNYFLFYFGINTGLRISDILRLRVKDVRGKDVMKIKMEKTETTVEVYFNTVLQQEIAKYTSNRADSDWLFSSRKEINRLQDKWLTHFTPSSKGLWD